jgi:hypothetical protein
MEMSVKNWVRVWAKTLVATPFVFMALVVAAATASQAIHDIDAVASWDGLFNIVRALPELSVYALMIGAIAGLPTLVIGLPMALILERLETTTFLNYAFTGLILGAVGGFVILAYDQYQHAAVPNYLLARTLTPVCAVYGLVAAVMFRLFSRGRSSRPKPRPEPAPLIALPAPADPDQTD